MAASVPTPDPAGFSAATNALDSAVAFVRDSDDFPAVASRIHQLMAILEDEDAAAQQLADLILQDYSLTVKVLRVANSFRFNRSSAPVLNARHAIVMMGAEAVRNLAAGLVVWEHFRRRAPGLRPLLMLSLLSANHARSLATTIGLNAIDEAYLLGMLRNLGEVLIACYFPSHYAAILKEMEERRCSPATACRRVLRFDYEELGRAVVREWGMPPTVVQTISNLVTPDDMHTVVGFAHRLTNAVYRQTPESSSEAVKMLLQNYARLRLSRDGVNAMLAAGIDGTRETFALAGVQLNDLQLKRQMHAALTYDGENGGAAGAEGAPGTGMPGLAEWPASAVPGSAGVDDRWNELNATMIGLLQQALKAGNCNRAVLALVSSARRELLGRLSAGEAGEMFVASFRFALGAGGGPLGLAAGHGQELVLARSWQLLPQQDRLLRSLEAGALAMIPFVVDGQTIGALYVDTPRNQQLDDRALSALRRVRDVMVKALARHSEAA